MACGKERYEVIFTTFVCDKCDEEFDLDGKFSVDDDIICEHCGHEQKVDDIIDRESIN